jgi:hypothetical protein
MCQQRPGTLRTIYQRYLGWYDANLAHRDLLPPVERARQYVEYMGGDNPIIARARAAYAEGDYRFVAEIMSHVGLANPSNAEARKLCADALEFAAGPSDSARAPGVLLSMDRYDGRWCRDQPREGGARACTTELAGEATPAPYAGASHCRRRAVRQSTTDSVFDSRSQRRRPVTRPVCRALRTSLPL